MSIDKLPIEMHPNIEHGIQIFLHMDKTILCTPHDHNFYEIFYVIQGKATHCCNNASSLIEVGSLVFIRPNDIHQYVEVSDNFSFYNLVFSIDTANKLFSLYDTDLLNDILKCSISPEIKLDLEDIKRLTPRFEKDFETLDIKKRSFYNVELLSSLLPLFIKSYQKEIIPNWFQELLDKIDNNKNYTKGLDYINTVATRSKEHVSRSFKKFFDTTPTDYINDKKLTYASNLLRQTSIDIIEISEMAGFNSLSHFYHLFKKRFSSSPKSYRKHNSIY